MPEENKKIELAEVFTKDYKEPPMVKFRFKSCNYDLRTITKAQIERLKEDEWPFLVPKQKQPAQASKKP